jgi:DNA polymerase III subunit delta'
MQFKEIIGQNSVKTQLIRSTNSDRIPHAQLFLGPTGSGKLALAMAFVQYVFCENKTENDACGKCNSCAKVEKLIHPDLHFSFPFIGSKNTSNNFLEDWRKAIAENPYMDINQWLQFIGAENKQGNINKDECLNIIRKLSLKSFEGDYKILIMWLPEYLGKEGNRLLKLIEEPPDNTLFILVAENQELILNTILSRCQIVKINQLSDEEVIDGLISKFEIEVEKAQSIAHLANGNFNEALKNIEHQENDNSKLFLEWMRKCYKGNGVELVAWVEKFAAIGRENQKHFLRYALHFLREYLIVKMTGNEKVRLQPEELKTAINLTKVIEFEQIQQMTKLLDDCFYYIERNANPKVLLLDASIKMNKILKNKVLVES